MKSILVFFIMFSSLHSFSQILDNESILEQLSFYSDVMINAEEGNHRMQAFNRFNTYFDDLCASGDIVSFKLDALKWVSVIAPEDESFRLVSWQVNIDGQNYDHRAYLIKKDGTVIKFERTELDRSQLAFMVLSNSEWYGCLYYKLRKLNDGKYLLFGFDANGHNVNRKIADVLIVQENSIQLGDEIFEDKNNRGTYANRLILDYSEDANVNLNYNPSLKMIVHDHLIKRMGRLQEQGPVNVPDGTYEGYSYEGGKWMYKEKIFNHTYDEAPRPKPVLDKKKGDPDLFGRS